MAAELERIASGYGLIEGPRVDAEDGLYFSDVSNGGVYRRSSHGEIATVVPKRRGVGGIALHRDGGIVISGRNVCHVRRGETRILLDLPNTPGYNDLFTDAQGHVYVGTMRSDPFRVEGPRETGELWRIDSEGRGTQLYPDVSLTNGIGFSPGEDRLYHSDTARGHILVHDLDPDGSWVRRRPFARLERGAPDGLAVDEEGGVWVAAYGGGCVARFHGDGRLDHTLELPSSAVTSVCFGGSDRRDLYIATADHSEEPTLGGCVFRTRSPLAGLAVPKATV